MSMVHLEFRGGVAELRLDNPAKLNALTGNMLDALEAHCVAIDAHSSVRCVLLTAAGDRAFCVGADIHDWAKLSPAEFGRHWIRRGHRIFDRIARFHVPSIAVLSGHAFGGGLELAAACDLRVISPGATIALPETGVGIVPGWSGTQRLARQLPPAVLKEMALTGRRISAERAHAIGFANGIADDPAEEARAMAAEICERSPAATETTKYLLSAALDEDRAAMTEALGGALMAGSPDKAEGVAAFSQKRKPDFKGNAS
jgi:enoyl-CoA hydratase/carnithine racemase